MRAFVDVNDKRKLEEFLKWMEQNGIEVTDRPCEEPFDIVVVNLPMSLPRSERKLMESEKLNEAGLLARASLRYEDMLPICDPEDYDVVMELFEKAGDVPKSVRRILSIKALLHSLSYVSKIHTRLSELFGVVDYVHNVWKVSHRILEKGYTEEYLTDIPERVFVGYNNPLIPIYVFALNNIPEESVMVFDRAVPTFASLDLNDAPRGEVLVYNGHIRERSRYGYVVSRGRDADIVSKKTYGRSLTVHSGGVGYRVEVDEDDVQPLERLALTFAFLSPMKTIAVFDEKKLLDISRHPDLDAQGLREGKILVANFKLEEVSCDRYERVMAPSASEKVRLSCGSKLLLRKL